MLVMQTTKTIYKPFLRSILYRISWRELFYGKARNTYNATVKLFRWSEPPKVKVAEDDYYWVGKKEKETIGKVSNKVGYIVLINIEKREKMHAEKY